jgi:8-oxo-dGTP diphosphatase
MQFNIRVYGTFLNEQKQMLVADEIIRNKFYTKFPGGGLEFGEGTRDCLKREFMEEMQLNVEVGEHLYTTDFYQLSAFHPDHQIVSIYYLVKPLEEITIPLKTMPFDFGANAVNGAEAFRFVDWKDVSEDTVTLPIDKVVVKIIKERFG